MGWVDNIDSENADDQPGCSGISNAPPQSIDNTPMEDSDPEETEQQPKEDPIRTFAEKVTIAGLEEAYTAEFLPVRIMFRLALVTAFAIITYEANSIAERYHDMNNIIITKLKDEPPFPNISVCFPPFMNATANLEAISDLTIPDRLRKMMRKYNTTFYDILEFMQRGATLNIRAADLPTSIFLMTRMLYDAFRDKAFLENGRVFDYYEYPCSTRISNCTFGHEIVDCCQNTQSLDLVQKRCLNIQPEKMKMNSNENGLLQFSFHAMIDWTFGHESLSDGFDLFIGKLPGQNQIPITVPSGMDAVIALAQPKLIHQADHCWQTEEIPNMKYVDYYDQDGIGCQYEQLQEMTHKFLNCRVPGLSYSPVANESCAFSQITGAYLAITGEFGDPKVLSQKQLEEGFKMASATAKGDSYCKPLCTRWISHVHSTSYGQITYSHHSHHLQFETQNKSWSRIRIIMPDPTYMDHQEMKVQAWYLAMCHIGGMMCVYAGFSAITIIQIIAYGAYVVWWKLKNREKKEESTTGTGKSQSPKRNDVCETAC